MVARRRAEGNALDSMGTNNGSPAGGITYTNGEVGQAFVFNGSTSYIPVPASPGLNVGTNNGFTIECWVQPSSAGVLAPLVEWDSASTDGLQRRVNGSLNLAVSIKDTSGNAHKFNTAAGVLSTNSLRHVAFTYDKSSGNAILYCNGVAVTNANFGKHHSTDDISGEYRPANGTAHRQWGYVWWAAGRIESIQSGADVQRGGGNLHCGSGRQMPAGRTVVIIFQPTNQTVTAGGAAAFSVTASGTLPLSYQWRFNGVQHCRRNEHDTDADATVQYRTRRGINAVLVTNFYGSILSSNAVLTVTLDHFAWNLIPSPRYVSAPFSVVIQAQDISNGRLTNFTGTAFLGTTSGVAVAPPVSGNFIQGAWTGSVVIAQTATNLVLRANDGLGHFGLANPINVISLPSLGILQSGNIALYMWPVDTRVPCWRLQAACRRPHG